MVLRWMHHEEVIHEDGSENAVAIHGNEKVNAVAFTEWDSERSGGSRKNPLDSQPFPIEYP